MQDNWLKNFDHFFTQSEVKPNPIMTAMQAISHALHQLHIIALSFDWFIVLHECVFWDWLEWLLSMVLQHLIENCSNH